jgi:uncharacterized protein YjbJ (UPF0337 family)
MGEKVDEAKGRTKKAVGEATDNKSLKDRGRIDKASAKTKKAVGGAAAKANKTHPQGSS